MLRTVNTVAAISRGQPLAELLAQHFGRKTETLTNGRHVSSNSLRFLPEPADNQGLMSTLIQPESTPPPPVSRR